MNKSCSLFGVLYNYICIDIYIIRFIIKISIDKDFIECLQKQLDEYINIRDCIHRYIKIYKLSLYNIFVYAGLICKITSDKSPCNIAKILIHLNINHIINIIGYINVNGDSNADDIGDTVINKKQIYLKQLQKFL